MFLIILGLIVLIAGFVVRSSPQQISHFSKQIIYGGLLLILIGVGTSCFVQVEAGQVGVKKLFGKVQPDVLESGLHFVNPLYEIEKLDVKTQNYTMSGIHDEGAKTGDDAIRVLTADGLEVTIDLTVLFRVNISEAPKLIKEIGVDYQDKLFAPLPVQGYVTMPFIMMPWHYTPLKEMNFSMIRKTGSGEKKSGSSGYC